MRVQQCPSVPERSRHGSSGRSFSLLRGNGRFPEIVKHDFYGGAEWKNCTTDGARVKGGFYADASRRFASFKLHSVDSPSSALTKQAPRSYALFHSAGGIARRGKAKKGAGSAQRRWKRARLSLSLSLSLSFLRQEGGCCLAGGTLRLLRLLSLSLWPFRDGSRALDETRLLQCELPLRRSEHFALRERFIEFRRSSK